MDENAKNKKIDEALEEIMRNQFANDVHKSAMVFKSFYDNFITVGFSESMAEKMILTIVGSTFAQKKL